MSVTILTKDVGEVKDRRCYADFKWGLEDGIEQWIKRDLRCEGNEFNS